MRRWLLLQLYSLALIHSSLASEAGLASAEYEPIMIREDDELAAGVAFDATQYLFPDRKVRPPLLSFPVRRLAIVANVGEYNWLYFPCHIELPLYHKYSPLFMVASGIVVPANSDIKSTKDLVKRTIGVWSVNIIPIAGVDDNPAVEKRTFNTPEAALRMMLLGRVDAVTMSELTFSYLTKTREDLKRDQFRFIKSFEIGMCLHHQKDYNNQLTDEMEQKIRIGQEKHVFEEILDKYR